MCSTARWYGHAKSRSSHRQPHVRVVPNANGSVFEPGRFHEISLSTWSKDHAEMFAVPDSTSRKRSSVDNRARCIGCTGPPSTRGSVCLGRPRRRLKWNGQLCLAGPIPRSTLRETHLPVWSWSWVQSAAGGPLCTSNSRGVAPEEAQAICGGERLVHHRSQPLEGIHHLCLRRMAAAHCGEQRGIIQ